MLREHNGVPYIIHIGPMGSLCAYVRIPDDHPWNPLVDKTKDIRGRVINVGYDDVPLDVHGGLTFSVRISETKNLWPQGFTPGAWVGWDYAHYRDYVPKLDKYFNDPESHLYIDNEVDMDCKDAINQMVAAGGNHEKRG